MPSDTDFLSQANDVLINVYPFWPVQFTRGDGVYVYDNDDKAYLDFGAGIAVNALGYHYPGYDEVLIDQIKKIHMGLCYVANEERIAAAQAIVNHSDMDQVFFCSTGAEAVEGCLKTARKWALETKGAQAYETIYAAESFHGRTMGALSVNGQDDLREGFEPLLNGAHRAIFNDISSIKKIIADRGADKIASIIIEPIQGEGGIIPATQEFLKELRQICDEHRIALIFDEVQCGMGRIGTLFAYQYYNIIPDLIAWAKGLGGGFPVGAYAGKKEFTAHITPGSHGSTYGGNPLACRIVSFMIEHVGEDKFLAQIRENGTYLAQEMKKLGLETGAWDDVRGLGLMLAADLKTGKAKDLIQKCLKQGLILLACGDNAIRLVPPLIITKNDIDQALTILKSCLTEK